MPGYNGINETGADIFRSYIQDESETLSRLAKELEDKYISEDLVIIEAKSILEKSCREFSTREDESEIERPYDTAVKSELLNEILNADGVGDVVGFEDGYNYVELRSGDSVVTNQNIL